MSIYIIAEIGINHNGDLELAKALIDEAKQAGCDAVKFQKRDIEKVYTAEFLNSYRESPWGTTQREQKEALEFNQSDYEFINNYCNEIEIDWFASAWDLNSQKFLNQFDLSNNKIASAMLVYSDLLRMVAKERKRCFISTGMSSYEEIEQAVNIFNEENCPYELMHCRSTYPMEDSHANLNAIMSLKKEFNCKVGYSGHESGLAISYAAAALGITSLERHITLDRAMYGSDQAASIEPAGLRQLVGAVRKIEGALGDGKIDVLPEEKLVAENLRQHLDWQS